MERLMERLHGGKAVAKCCGAYCQWKRRYCEYADSNCPSVMEIYEKLADYEDAEEQGLLVRLPCKVGDTVYVLDRDGKTREMILDKPDIRCHCAKEDNLCMATCDSPSAGVCAYRLMNDGSDLGKKCS